MSSGETATGSVARAPQPRLLQVVWRPFTTTVGPEHAVKTPQGSSPDAWLASNHVELQYDLATLQRNEGAKRRDPEESEQLLAAFRVAFSVLCYVALQRVLSRARQTTDRAAAEHLASACYACTLTKPRPTRRAGRAPCLPHPRRSRRHSLATSRCTCRASCSRMRYRLTNAAESSMRSSRVPPGHRTARTAERAIHSRNRHSDW